MKTLTNEQIKEIADMLDSGFRCVVHKETREFISIPEDYEEDSELYESWEEDINKWENDWANYIEIEGLDSNDSYKIMLEFAEELDDSNPLKNKLLMALEMNKPFRRFKDLLDYEDEYRQKWFRFKEEYIQQWVLDKIKVAMRQGIMEEDD